MAGSKQCPKCSSSMSEGFIIDHTESGTTVGSWVEGQPAKSVWTGLKLGGRPKLDMAAWRCGRCGFVELYASGTSVSAAAAEAQRKSIVFAAVIAAVVAAVIAAVGVAILIG
jgi:ribosomal protein S27AE